jgi:glucose/arabinose dehydrogenase
VNRSRSVAAIVAATAALVIAACGSDDSSPANESFGSGQPSGSASSSAPTSEAVSAPASDPVSTASTATPATTPSSATTDVAGPNADTIAPGPLTESSVTLFEIGSFDQPVEVAARAGSGEIYIVEQPGRVVAVTDLSTEVVLDITDLTDANGEQGLLGLAFHPTDDLAYMYYTDTNGNTVVAEFTIDPATGTFDRDSRREVLTVEQPYSNHNGGQLAFGPDQLLYIGLGDGGSGGDPERYALDLTSRLGKILRIDPVASPDGAPFTVPTDNPFVDDPAADPTIWAYGLRNPWRFSFDPPTGDLWIGDVGQGAFEEINHSVATERRDAGKGVNFGWSAFEGFERFNDDQPVDGAVAPLFVYDHADGRCSVTGGTVARSTAVADLAGWYVFGDYCSGQIWALDPTAPPTDPRVIEIAQLDTLVAVAAGPDRELYVVSGGGTVARIITA